jgi:hypothetical protein
MEIKAMLKSDTDIDTRYIYTLSLSIAIFSELGKG